MREDGRAVAEKEHRRDSGKGGVPGGSGPWSEGAGGFEFAVCGDRESPEVTEQGRAQEKVWLREADRDTTDSVPREGRVNLGGASKGQGHPRERGV